MSEKKTLITRLFLNKQKEKTTEFQTAINDLAKIIRNEKRRPLAGRVHPQTKKTPSSEKVKKLFKPK